MYDTDETPPGRARTLLLGRSEIAALLDLDECIAAVERAFILHAEGKTLPPGVLGVPAQDGGFHIKAAGLELGRTYFAAKVNGNFPDNARRFGLPTIQGVVVLCDAANGCPLALMDSIEITSLRTGAATAVAAKHLARSDARVATICGCGNQGRIQLRALMRVRPLQRAYAFDIDERRAEQFAREVSEALRIEVRAVRELPKAVGESDICVTCTPSRRFFLRREDVSPGTFIAAVGADSPEKQELEPALLASSTVVVDLLEQCATIGELHHALAEGCMAREDVHAELAEVIAGRKPGRTSAEEITLFDSSGTALQDAAAAAAAYEKALGLGRGLPVDLLG
jgi:alanine dehydrogenase